MPHVPSPTSSRVSRPGVTMLELLVVLTILALSAAVVLPALVPPARESRAGWETAVANARRTAIRRGERVRFRLDRDGVWAVVATDATVVDSGRVVVKPTDTLPTLDVTIDPLGSCLPTHMRDEATFDVLRCVWHMSTTGR